MSFLASDGTTRSRGLWTIVPAYWWFCRPRPSISTKVTDEVSFALEKGKTVILILHRECAIPFRLHRVQYIDLRHDNPRGLAELKILVVRARTQGAHSGLPIREERIRKSQELPHLLIQ